MKHLRKENGQFAGISEQFTLMEKLSFCFGLALLLVLVLLIVAGYAVKYALVVKEVWANMDNAAYTNYVRGYATSTEEPAVIMEKIARL
jgi:hypothetical protein